MKKINFLIGLGSLIFSLSSFGKTVTYDLEIENIPVNLSGQKTVDFALMVNKSIPAPTLEFTEGDDAVITVHNKLKKEEVSLHWHGILLPPLMDGVPYTNTPPIFPGKSFTFKFKVRQNGTYWYHSHTSVQEQKGVYGAIVIHPRTETVKADKDLVVVVSDWSDENADNIIKNLRKDGDYYLYKKDSMRSYFGALEAHSFGSHLSNEWNRMGGMDLSDVGYDAFLINGKKDSQLLIAHPGEEIRVRVINASASSYFYVSLGGLPMKVISADGKDIKPMTANEILIATAETYDILFTVPEHKNFELRATSQDVTGFASGWIGMGEKVYAKSKEKPNLYSGMSQGGHEGHGATATANEHLQHSGHAAAESPSAMEHPEGRDVTADKVAQHGDHSMHGEMNHEMHAVKEDMPEAAVVGTLTVDELSAQNSTQFSKDKKVYELKLVLGGDMERYVWHINGKAIHQDRNININEGDVVRFIYENQTMMHHPMHLHGHFFRVLNKNGAYSPLKHTVDVPPHGTRTIEFFADEPGQWMLHCHNLYHMKTGMARIVRYNSFTPTGEMAEYDKKDPHLHEHIYYDGMLEAATNHAQAKFRLSKTWDTLETRLENRDYDNLDHAEGDIFYRRWFSNYLNLILGGTYSNDYEKDKTRAVLGVGSILPMLVETNLLVDHTGKLRLDLEKKFQWTKYIYSDADVTFRENQDTEFEITLMYANAWKWSAGLMFTEGSAGVGAQYKF